MKNRAQISRVSHCKERVKCDLFQIKVGRSFRKPPISEVLRLLCARFAKVSAVRVHGLHEPNDILRSVRRERQASFTLGGQLIQENQL
jgi:hypothetical protein